ncbi:MAG: hypothetical protein F6K10_08945 [Moorea sp. SIO2B7]|uniref:Uncharacterized protein n=1 Tax=Moorena producens 3L TaxID=489825 RepID=F4XZS8_9CYAN|nr:hypothetical protein LYNGBM3L_59500 [Moorena producens 3L]NES81515.1 hypothetical protein [Moorena sp. SIO2B7]
MWLFLGTSLTGAKCLWFLRDIGNHCRFWFCRFRKVGAFIFASTSFAAYLDSTLRLTAPSWLVLMCHLLMRLRCTQENHPDCPYNLGLFFEDYSSNITVS